MTEQDWDAQARQVLSDIRHAEQQALSVAPIIAAALAAAYQQGEVVERVKISLRLGQIGGPECDGMPLEQLLIRPKDAAHQHAEALLQLWHSMDDYGEGPPPKLLLAVADFLENGPAE